MCKMLPVCFEESPMAILKENKQVVKQKKMCCKSPEAEPRNVGLNKEGQGQKVQNASCLMMINNIY